MEAFIFICLILFFIVLIMWREYVGNRQYLKNRLEQIYAAYGTPPERTYGAEELARISMYYQKHQRADQIDDITWNAGAEYLYYRLRTPAKDGDELLYLEKRIRFFMEQEEERHRLQKICYQLGRTGRHSIYEYLDHLDLL